MRRTNTTKKCVHAHQGDRGEGSVVFTERDGFGNEDTYTYVVCWRCWMELRSAAVALPMMTTTEFKQAQATKGGRR